MKPQLTDKLLEGAKNKYVVNGKTSEILITRRNGDVLTVLIDTTDIPILKKFTWTASWMESARKFYVYSRSLGKNSLIHRVLMDTPSNLEVDHINHNPLDNRRSNLREVTSYQNKQNKSGAQKNSKTGIRGVSWSKCNKMWRATVKIHGKLVYIKQFHDLNEAAAAVKEARKRLMPFSTN